MDIREFNNELKRLREIILKEEKIEESKALAIKIHCLVHEKAMSGIDVITYEDELWNDINDHKFRETQNNKGRTVAYGMWHTTRIEDITMNLLVEDSEQVINKDNWQQRINSPIVDTGNALTTDEILQFSKYINMEELRNYRIAVGRRTNEIISKLSFHDMKRKFNKSQLQRILDEGAVLDVEASNWLIDFWGRKNVAGILLMPATRHNLVHISESLKAKKKR